MAAPLLQTDTTTLEKIKDILSRYKNWNELEKSETDKQAFLAIFLLNAGFFGSHYFEKPDTAFKALAAAENLEEFLVLKEPPLDQSTVDAALLAQLVEQMHVDQEDLKKKIGTGRKKTSETVEMVRRVWLLNQALALRNKINPELLQELNQAIDQTTPKEEDRAKLRPSIIDEAENIAKFTINAVMDVTKVSSEKIGEATAIITTAAAIFPDYKDDIQTQRLVTDLIINTVDPNHETDITKVRDQIRQATLTATANDYAAALTHPELPIAVNTPNNTVTDFSKIVVPEKINTESAGTIIAKVKEVDYRYQERVASITDTTQTISEKFQRLSQSVTIAVALYSPLEDSVVNEITHAAAGIVPDQIRIPSKEGSLLAAFVKEMPASSHLNQAGIRLYASGITPEVFQKLREHATKNPQSAINKILIKPEITRQLFQAQRVISNIHHSPVNESGRNLGGEIKHRPNFFSRFQTLTNPIISRLPTRLSGPTNFIFHPIASIRSYVGRKTGQFVARQLLSRVVDRLGIQALKLAGQTLLEKGLAAGLKKLVTQAAISLAVKTGLITAAQALNVIPGLGLVVGAAILVGSWLLEKLFKKPQDIGMAPIAAVAALSGLTALPASAIQGAVQTPSQLINSLAAAVTGAVVVGSSAAATILIATVIGLFLYLTAFTAAPLISTLAQLQSGLGTQQGLGGPILPPYTGPILPGCPSSWPISTGVVIQGPHGSYSHQFVEGIDIHTPVGTSVQSLTDGTVTAAGWATANPAYGNWVKIDSTTSSGQKYTIIYAHLSEIRVAAGNNVQAGSVIALSGNTSAVASFANPHLHLEYVGINYNSCPAGGIQIPNGCYGTDPSRPNSCTINGKQIRI